MIELMVFGFDATFVAIIVFGHALLIGALVQCAGDGPADGHGMPVADWTHRWPAAGNSLSSSALALQVSA